MIDAQAIKNKVDCRDIVERDLGKPKTRAQTYSTYRCSFHRERKGYSLVVYWMMRYHQLSFQQACECLSSGDLPQRTEPIFHDEHPLEPFAEPPNDAWQKIAHRIAGEVRDRLWSPEGKRALNYLQTKRGLSEPIIQAAGLGFIPGRPFEWKIINDVKVPCGIAIPWYADGALWGIKVRRAAGGQRYQQVSGGNLRRCLYLADEVHVGSPILLTEGEFDALIAMQVGRDYLSPASIGSASNSRINRRWFGKLMSAPQILVCMDSDDAGLRAASEIAMTSSAVRVIQVPLEKGLNAFSLHAGEIMVTTWLQSQLQRN